MVILTNLLAASGLFAVQAARLAWASRRATVLVIPGGVLLLRQVLCLPAVLSTPRPILGRFGPESRGAQVVTDETVPSLFDALDA
jgi:hypothetical protein